MTISKRNIIVVVVILIVGAIIFGFWQYKTKQANVYSIVYMATKEVYVGKLTTFPDFKLTDGYVLTTVPDTTDPKKSNFQLTPIKDALWAPESMHFVKNNVVFYGLLLPDSKIVETITAEKK